MATRAKSNRRPEIESILDEHGVKYTYVPAVSIEDIERHPDSQSRLRDADEKLVGEYAEKMKRGAIFPPLILWKDGYDGYGLVDGNSRAEAKKKRGLTETDAYLVEIEDSNEAVYVSAIFNATHGQRLTKEEVKHAVIAAGLMTNKRTNDRLAQDYGITPGTVTKIQKVHTTTNELVKLGVNPSQLTESAIYTLSKLGDTAVKRDLATLVIDTDLAQGEVGALVKDIQTKTSEADRLKVISDARTARQAHIEAKRTGRVVDRQPLHQASMVFGQLAKLIESFPDPEQWVPVDATRRQETLPRIKQIHDFLGQVCERYEVEVEATL